MKKRLNAADIDNAINDILNSGSLYGRDDLMPQCMHLHAQATGMKYKKGIGTVSSVIAAILMSSFRYDEAKPYLDESVKLLTALKERNDLYFSVMLLQAEMETAGGNFDVAIKITTSLIVEFKDKMSATRYAHCCLNAGTIYYMMGLLYNSLYTYQKVLSRRDEFRHVPRFNAIWMSYANLLKELTLYDKSLEHLLTISGESNLTKLDQMRINMDIANLYAEGFNDFENSKKHMDECLRLAELHNNTVIYNTALGNWGANLLLLGKYKEALPLLTDDRVKNLMDGSKVDMVSLNSAITIGLLHTGRIKEAAKYLELTESLIGDTGLTLQRTQHYDNYFLYYSLTKNYDEAIRYHNLYKSELNETRRMAHNLQMQQLDALLELEKREGELAIEKLQHKQSQREVEFAQQQNALMQTNIEQRNNLIDEFQKAIKRMESSDTRRKEIFKGLHEKINSVRRSSIETAAYDTKYNTLHHDGIQKLHTLFPAITPGEAKVAVMLSSGLSNKEIAAITLTTPRNIENHRLQLRKKLKLKTGEDLLERVREILQSGSS